MTDKRRDLYLLLAIVVLGTIVFLPSITGGWIYDDRPLIDENPYIRSFGYVARWFTTDFWSVGAEAQRMGSSIAYWRPGITATYAMDWAIGGGTPLIFHVMNLLYQAAVCALAFVVLRRWVGKAVPAFVAALLFAIHPTKAESVAWIAGRTDVICMIAVLVAAQGMAWRHAGRRGGLALEIVGTMVAYVTKEQAIVLPAFAAIEAWIAFGRPAIEWPTVKKLIPRVLPQTVLAIAYLAVRIAVLPIQSSDGSTPLPAGHHLLAVLETMGRFATLTFAPHDLSLQHGLVHVIRGEPLHSLPYVIIGAVTLAALVAIAIVARKRWAFVTLGIGFFLVTIAPTSNLVYTGMETLVSERFLYLPLFGLTWVAGELLARVPATHLRPVLALTGAIALAFAMLSMSRSADFLDEQAFWARELRLHPDSKQAAQYAITTANRESRYHDSLQALLMMHGVVERYDREPGREILFAFQVADVTSRLVADHQTAELIAIDRFVDNVLARKPAELHVLDVNLAMGVVKDSALKELVRYQPRMLALRAEIAGRLGNDAQALVFAGQANVSCPRCTSTVYILAVANARAGRYDEALRVLEDASGSVPEKSLAAPRSHIEKAIAAHQEAATAEGPAKLRARAAELAALELWGRAYEVLAPYKEQIKQAPGAARGFAELAFRAGEPEVAREVLEVGSSSDEVDELFASWAQKMGWVR